MTSVKERFETDLQEAKRELHELGVIDRAILYQACSSGVYQACSPECLPPIVARVFTRDLPVDENVALFLQASNLTGGERNGTST